MKKRNNVFESSQSLADWSASILMDKGIDDIADWRMLEYWMQVELYRAIQSGTGGSWRHIGDYEHPYFTDHPKSGAKTNTKWIDYYSVNLKLHRQIALHG